MSICTRRVRRDVFTGFVLISYNLKRIFITQRKEYYFYPDGEKSLWGCWKYLHDSVVIPSGFFKDHQVFIFQKKKPLISYERWEAQTGAAAHFTDCRLAECKMEAPPPSLSLFNQYWFTWYPPLLPLQHSAQICVRARKVPGTFWEIGLEKYQLS